MSKTPTRTIRLRSQDLASDPVEQFERWYLEAESLLGGNFNAMTLATLSGDQPNARIVLLRGFGRTGFRFFTNYESQKGQELAKNPAAALVFYWEGLSRQVRIRGTVARLSAAESDAYFAGRRRGKQLGARASDQSTTISSRGELENRLDQVEMAYSGKEVDRPDHWGGYNLIPDELEFWQGESSRLHDRFRYRRGQTSTWHIERLAP